MEQAPIKTRHVRRMTFGQVLDRVFWSLVTSLGVYASNELKSVNTNISELNKKLAVVVEKMTNTERRLDSQDHLIERIEDRIDSKK